MAEADVLMNEPADRATAWLDRTYRGRVVLADREPFAEGEHSWLLSCRWAERAPGSMLAATIAVSRYDLDPFPVANADPFNEELNFTGLEVPEAQPWRWRLNARNCVVAMDAAVDARPVSALAWQPDDEAPGWWDRLIAGHFPGAEVATCASWAEACAAIAAGGPGTRAAVWLRRSYQGREVTGNLLYAHHHDGGVVVLDGQQSALATLADDEVGELVVARFHRQEPAPGAVSTGLVIAPWQSPAPDLPSAIEKASRWLEDTYGGAAVLVDPDPADELARGWLFACTTKRFQQTGDWQDQMLDAALMVPKAAGEAPFGLPNPDPWTWLDLWNQDEDPLLPAPPGPGAASWFRSTMDGLGPVLGSTEHHNWHDALVAVAGFAPDSRSVIWVRRQDGRGRETVGNLVLAVTDQDGFLLMDPMTQDNEPVVGEEPLALHVIRYG